MTELVRTRETCRLCGVRALVRSVPLASVPIVSPNVGTEANDSGDISAPIIFLFMTSASLLCHLCSLIEADATIVSAIRIV